MQAGVYVRVEVYVVIGINAVANIAPGAVVLAWQVTVHFAPHCLI